MERNAAVSRAFRKRGAGYRPMVGLLSVAKYKYTGTTAAAVRGVRESGAIVLNRSGLEYLIENMPCEMRALQSANTHGRNYHDGEK